MWSFAAAMFGLGFAAGLIGGGLCDRLDAWLFRRSRR